jgi:hypothetical protein
MEIVHKACAGLDVQKKTVVAAIIVTGERGELRKELRTFGTMTSNLFALSDWLMALGGNYFDSRRPEATANRLAKRLENCVESGKYDLPIQSRYFLA